MTRTTTLSPDRVYRYTLWREWWRDQLPRPLCRDCADGDGVVCIHDPSKRCDPGSYAMFIGLNPSTADETKDDQTIRKCIGFAKRWGYGALCMTNLFAFRATDPRVMRKEAEPIGVENHHHILQCAKYAGIVIAAWGVNGMHMKQDLNVRQWLSSRFIKLHCLRFTKDGHPEHPLYIPYETTPKQYGAAP